MRRRQRRRSCPASLPSRRSCRSWRRLSYPSSLGRIGGLTRRSLIWSRNFERERERNRERSGGERKSKQWTQPAHWPKPAGLVSWSFTMGPSRPTHNPLQSKRWPMGSSDWWNFYLSPPKWWIKNVQFPCADIGVQIRTRIYLKPLIHMKNLLFFGHTIHRMIFGHICFQNFKTVF